VERVVGILYQHVTTGRDDGRRTSRAVVAGT
jgi:hypothetical protein